MNGKTKMIVGIALALSILSIAFFATPILAYANGNVNGDLLQNQDGDRLRTQDHDCNCDCTQTQYRSRQRINECTRNRVCNCTTSMEQYRHQYRERTRTQG